MNYQQAHELTQRLQSSKLYVSVEVKRNWLGRYWILTEDSHGTRFYVVKNRKNQRYTEIQAEIYDRDHRLSDRIWAPLLVVTAVTMLAALVFVLSIFS